MGYKEGHHRPQLFHPGQLVPAQKLTMDDHRAQVFQLGTGLFRLFQAAQELLRCRISVAVAQQLGISLPCRRHGGNHRFIGHGAVAPVIRVVGVRLSHPGGAALGGAVQENLHAPQGQAAGFRQDLGKPVIVLGSGVGHRIPFQPGLFLQGLVNGQQFFHHHAVLEGGDAMTEVDLLGLLISPEQLIQRRQGDPPQGRNEGVFLQVAGEPAPFPADFSPLRVRGVRGNGQFFQSQ